MDLVEGRDSCLRQKGSAGGQRVKSIISASVRAVNNIKVGLVVKIGMPHGHVTLNRLKKRKKDIILPCKRVSMHSFVD